MNELDAALSAIFERSRPILRERLALVEAGGPEAVGAAHKLAGSLGTFGLWEGSEVSREIEQELLGDADPGRVGALTARLRDLLAPHLG